MAIEKIDQKKFFALLLEDGYAVNIIYDLFSSGKVENGDCVHFNQTIQKIHKIHGLKIFDMPVYLESVFSDFKKIVEFLDAQTNKILIAEIADTYYIKKERSKFEDLE